MSNQFKIERLRQLLLDWGNANIRDFPWRRTQDPYLILIAEFMLHRTQAFQVLRVYNRFLNQCPTLAAFVDTRTDDVRKILQPLGLQWRIERMIDALFHIWKQYKEVPMEKNSLESIPGIGPYIANATLCFSSNKPLALIDTNTVRVTGRFFGMKVDSGARRRKEMIEIIKKSCDPKSPRNYYYSMIDLSHLICKTKKPECVYCPLLDSPCSFGQNKSIRKASDNVFKNCIKTADSL